MASDDAGSTMVNFADQNAKQRKRRTRELAVLCIIAATSGMLAWALDRPLTAAAFAAAATFMAICLVSIELK
jgi:hypothetical protein